MRLRSAPDTGVDAGAPDGLAVDGCAVGCVRERAVLRQRRLRRRAAELRERRGGSLELRPGRERNGELLYEPLDRRRDLLPQLRRRHELWGHDLPCGGERLPARQKYEVTVGRFRATFVKNAPSVAGWQPSRRLRNSHAPERREGARRESGQRVRARLGLLLEQQPPRFAQRLEYDSRLRRPGADLDSDRRRERKRADQLRDLGAGLRLLHLGRRLLAERGRVEFRGPGQGRATRLSVVEPAVVRSSRLHVRELLGRP